MLTIPPKIRFLGPVSHYYVFKRSIRESLTHETVSRRSEWAAVRHVQAVHVPRRVPPHGPRYVSPFTIALVPPHASDRRFDGTSRRGRPSSVVVAARPAGNGESATVARAVATKSPSTDGLDAVQPSTRTSTLYPRCPRPSTRTLCSILNNAAFG